MSTAVAGDATDTKQLLFGLQLSLIGGVVYVGESVSGPPGPAIALGIGLMVAGLG